MSKTDKVITIIWFIAFAFASRFEYRRYKQQQECNERGLVGVAPHYGWRPIVCIKPQ